MVLAEQDVVLGNTQFRRNCCPHPELVYHPSDHRFAENFIRQWVGLQDGHQDTIKFSKGLFEESDVVDITAANSCSIQAKLNGAFWKAEIVLNASKSLLFGRSDQLAIAQQCCRRIVVIAGNSEDVHLALAVRPFQIDDILS